MTDLNKIMIVDDEEDILEIAVMAMEVVGGYDVAYCEDGQQALDKVGAINPDVIILDWMMPGMNGPTVYGKLREQGNTTPVIFMTAKVQREEVESLLALGAIGVIAKPFDPMTLAQEVASLWEGSNAC